MIGNDIVDLKLASQQSNWKRKNFLTKVFTLGERKILKASENINLSVWLLWSMKEAAYKAHQRKWSLPRSLNWTAQECVSLEKGENTASGIVEIQEETYFGSSILTSNWIHTIMIHERGSHFRQGLFQQPLVKTKQVFKEEIFQLLQASLPELQIIKSEAGIPFLHHDQGHLPLNFSFSDHGRFSGFCVSLMDS